MGNHLTFIFNLFNDSVKEAISKLVLVKHFHEVLYCEESILVFGREAIRLNTPADHLV
jgi:hypothetical protein